MSQISSINFQKSKDFQVFHNSTIRPSYAIGGGLEYTLKGYAARSLKEKLIAEAKKTYENTIKQPFKAKSYEWSAVVNLKPNSTMQDLERLAKHFNDKYGFQCYQIAIHRDEGHISDTGEKIINHHAHLEFITLDKNTGKNNYRRELITPSVLRQIQSETAQILGMERGIDKRLSGVERIEPRKYAKMKEAERTKIRELKAKALRVSQEQEGEILALRAENEVSNISFNTQKLDLEQTIRELSNEHSILQDELWQNKKENFLLKNQNSDLNAQICVLSNEKKKIDPNLTQELKNAQKLSNELKNELNKKETLFWLENFRQKAKNKGFPKSFFDDFNALKREIKGNKATFNKKELDKALLEIIKKNPRQALKKPTNNENQALQDELRAQKEQNEKLLKRYQNAINGTWDYLNALSAFVPNIEQSLFDKMGMSYKIEFRMPFLTQDQVNAFAKNQENLKIEQEKEKVKLDGKNQSFLNLTLKYFHKTLLFARIYQDKESLQDTIQDLKNNNLENSYLNYISSRNIHNALDKANEYLKSLKMQEQQKSKGLSR